MTKKELQLVLKVLGRIKDPDAKVLEAIFTVNKNIEHYNAMKGQLRNMYEVDLPGY